MLSKKILEVFSDIDEDLLIRTLFEMNRYYDKNFKFYFADYKKRYGNTLNSFQRKILRNYYYYGYDDLLEELHIEEFPKLEVIPKDVEEINQLTLEKLASNNSPKIIHSIYSKVAEINKYNQEKINASQWLNQYYDERYYRYISIKIDQSFINNYQEQYFSKLLEIIHYAYDHLYNYRYISIVLSERVYYQNIDISWDLLSKLAIYMENFKQFSGEFYPFHRAKKIEELLNFLKNHKNLRRGDFKKEVSQFYSTISTGFVFNDLLLSENQDIKILIMRKIELDEEPVPCPSCMQKTSRGNSYPLMFLKSWECQNLKCPERSKSGRGKRYDEYGTFRYFKLVENNEFNVISKSLYMKWHRDIFDSHEDIYEMLFTYYSWDHENVLLINDLFDKEFKTRRIFTKTPEEIKEKITIQYEELPIYQLLYQLCSKAKEFPVRDSLKEEIELRNMDSTRGLYEVQENCVQAAITSPPYYNAREYSQWPTLITYLIDMMLSARAVYHRLKEDGVYLYNIGDIVDRDNVYVSSNMSKRRIMLGFYSTLVFQMVGFQLMGNKIWDKGEVESKRNSTVNLFSGYVKYINCYEHVFVFKKQKKQVVGDHTLHQIKPVYKINSRGKNILGHTAPYPEELVELVRGYLTGDGYLLDPFLGSGTTGIWARGNQVKFLGYELDKEYFKLATKRIYFDHIKKK